MALSPPDSYAAELRDLFRDLLEMKHLYQSVDAIPSESVRKMIDLIEFKPRAATGLLPRLLASVWQPQVFSRPDHDAFLGGATDSLKFDLQSIKVMCKACGRKEPFNPVSCDHLVMRTQSGNIVVQVWALAYMCLSCKGPEEVFLVRRDGTRLRLCGRAPMEFVEAPKEIPKNEAGYFRDALLAHQSGQTLPALFLLRVLVEQFVRRAIGADERADAALDKYTDGLPSDFRERFPSLREIYGKLSDAIHTAREDDALFKAASAGLVEHFDARRLFKLLPN